MNAFVSASLRLCLLGLLALPFPSSASAQAPGLSLGAGGVAINTGPGGTFTLPIPGLKRNDQDHSGERPVVVMQDGAAVAKYPSGAELRLSVSDADKSVTGTYSGIPAGAKGFVFQTQIPIRFNNGGSFILGKKAAKPFPENKEKQIVDDGWGESFTLIDPSGSGYEMRMPGAYQQLQDNRVFNWAVFMHIYSLNFADQKQKNTFTFKFSGLDPAKVAAATPGTPAGAPAIKPVVVDRFGQSARKDWPTKVKTEEELKADVDQEKASLGKPSGPAVDAYGGLAGSGEQFHLAKTGYFHVGQAGGRQVLVTPEGNAFFQLGVCGIANSDDFTTVKGREKIFEWLPAQKDDVFLTAWREKQPTWGFFSFYIANWIRKYGRPFTYEEWSAQAVTRLRAWGFNSSGAFSDYSAAMRSAQFPTVSFLPLGAGGGVQVLPDKVGGASLMDPFVPGTEEALDKKFAGKIAAQATDPLLIGYFLGNEQHLEILPKLIPSYKASKVAAKGRLVEMLRTKYPDIGAFNAAWNPATPFADFEAVKEEPLFVRTDAAAADMKTFYELYLETYFSMVNRVFRQHDPNHMLIGSRMTPGTANNEIAVRASGKYMEVVSINYYTYAIEEPFLKRVSEWSGNKPIILSEWYFQSSDHGLGSGNVRDQSERGKAYRNYIEQAAALPYVVGSQWFIYGDQALTGRFFEGFNGEGNNTGLIDVTDRPYQPLIDAAKTTHARIYDVMLNKEKPYAFEDPRFSSKGSGGRKVVSIPKALPGMKFDGSTSHWPGRPAEPIPNSRLVSGVPNPALRGDFRLCWDETNLHFLIQVKDPTPLMNDKDAGSLWSADAVELFIGARDVTTPGSLLYSDRQILLGAGKDPKVHIGDHADEAKEIKTLVVKDVSGDGYVLEAIIPWKVLGLQPQAGMEMLFDVAIDNSDDAQMRAQQLVWNGTAKNSSDRGAWGQAKLLEN